MEQRLRQEKNITFMGRKYKSAYHLAKKADLKMADIEKLLVFGFDIQESIRILIGCYFQVEYKDGDVYFQGFLYSSLDELVQNQQTSKEFFIKSLDNIPLPLFKQLEVGYIYKNRMYWTREALLSTLKLTEEEFDNLDAHVFSYQLDMLRKEKRRVRQNEYRKKVKADKKIK